MVILTVIRRLSIFVIAVALLINSVLLVLAKNARDGRNAQPEAFKIRAFVPNRKTAEDLAKNMQVETKKVKIFPVSRERSEPTGGWRAEMKFYRAPAGQVENIAATLANLGVSVVIDSNDDGSRSVRAKQDFSSKAEAENEVRDVSRRSNGLFKMSAVPAMKKVPYQAWCLEVSVVDSVKLNEIKEQLKGKASLDVQP